MVARAAVSLVTGVPVGSQLALPVRFVNGFLSGKSVLMTPVEALALTVYETRSSSLHPGFRVRRKAFGGKAVMGEGMTMTMKRVVFAHRSCWCYCCQLRWQHRTRGRHDQRCREGHVGGGRCRRNGGGHQPCAD